MGKISKMIAGEISSILDMSEAARMARAKEMGFDLNPYQHTSKTRFVGSSAEDDAILGITRAEEFKKTYGGNYFGRYGETNMPEEKLAGDYGETSDYLLNKGNFIDARFKNMTPEQKKEVKEIVNGSFDSDDIENIRAKTGDEEWEPFDSFISGELWADTGRESQNKVINSILKNYDSVTYKDNPAYGVDSVSTVVKNPNQIRSVNAAFDPAKKDSSNLLAGAATVGGIGGGAALMGAPQDSFAASFQEKPSARDIMTAQRKREDYLSKISDLNKMDASIKSPVIPAAARLANYFNWYNQSIKGTPFEYIMPEAPTEWADKLAYDGETDLKTKFMAAMGLSL